MLRATSELAQHCCEQPGLGMTISSCHAQKQNLKVLKQITKPCTSDSSIDTVITGKRQLMVHESQSLISAPAWTSAQICCEQSGLQHDNFNPSYAKHELWNCCSIRHKRQRQQHWYYHKLHISRKWRYGHSLTNSTGLRMLRVIPNFHLNSRKFNKIEQVTHTQTDDNSNANWVV